MTEANPGRFHRVDPRVVDDDPFWSVVRRRHPDVTIVLTPQEEPADVIDEPAAPTELLRAAADGALEAWHLLRPLVLDAGATDPPSIRWGAKGHEHALVIEKAVTGLGPDGGVRLLRSVAEVLAAAGWRLRPTGRDHVAVLEASDGHTDLRAVSGAGATVLTIATGVLPISAVDRETVVAELREVMTSWE